MERLLAVNVNGAFEDLLAEFVDGKAREIDTLSFGSKS